MASNFDSGIFSPTPTTGNLIDGPNFGGDGLSFAANTIGRAMSQRQGNVFDQTLGAPLRKRKRREIAKELAEEGIKPSDPKYFEKFRDKLTEAGDFEGAEVVEARRVQQEQLSLERQQVEAGIDKTKAQTESIKTTDDLNKEKFDHTKIVDIEKLDILGEELAISRRKTDNDEVRTAILQKEVGLAQRRVDLLEQESGSTIELREAQADLAAANARMTHAEADVVEKTGKLKSSSTAKPGVARKVTKADVASVGPTVKAVFSDVPGVKPTDKTVQQEVAALAEVKRQLNRDAGVSAQDETTLKREAAEEIRDRTEVEGLGSLARNKTRVLPMPDGVTIDQVRQAAQEKGLTTQQVIKILLREQSK